MAYIIGNLLGRLIMSAFIVWAVLFLMKRFDYKVATKSLKKPVPMLSIFVLFFLGLLAGAS